MSGLQYQIENQEGVKDTLGANDIIQQLASSGQNVVGMSADGSTIKMNDGQGEFDVKVEDVLKHHGWNVAGMMPQDASYDHVNPEWRAAISMLPADDHKRAYIEGQMKRSGLDNVNIVGSGRDWFAFDPQQNRYIALTNSPEWDKSDAGEFLTEVPRAVGATLGGAAGAVAGGGITPMAIATGAGGAALGGGAADAITRMIAAEYDPVLKQVMIERFGDIAKDVGVKSAFDAAGGALLPGAGVIGKGAYNAMKTGPISTMAKGLGSLAEGSGRVMAKGAGLLDRPFGREVASTMIPVAGDAVSAGMLAQMPGMAARGAARGIGSLGETQMLKNAAPELAQGMRLTSQQLMRPVRGSSNFTGQLTKGAEEAAGFLSGVPKPPPGKLPGTTEDIFGNLGEMIGGARGPDYRKALYGQYKTHRAGGALAEEAAMRARDTVPLSENAILGRDIGRKIGRGFQTVENLGKDIEKIGTGATSAVLKGARLSGNTMNKAGVGARLTGTLAQPIENKTAMRYGAEEFLGDDLNKYLYDQKRRKSEPTYMVGR